MSSPNYFVEVSEVNKRGVIFTCEWLMGGDPDHEYGKNMILQFLIEASNANSASNNDIPPPFEKKMALISELSSVKSIKYNAENYIHFNKEGKTHFENREILQAPSQENNFELILERDYTTFCSEAEILVYLMDVVELEDPLKAHYIAFLRYEWLLSALKKGMRWESTAFDYSAFSK